MSKKLTDENPVKINELKEAVRMSIIIKRALMVWGPPGIGKSEAIEQIALEQNRPLIDLRLLLMEPTDLRGMPYKTEYIVFDDEGNEVRKEETVRWAPPEELPKIGFKDNAILFLDEISAAAPTVQAAAYQLVLNRRIGPYELPPGVDIIAAGNRMSDKAVAFRMPSALANRFVHCTLTPNFSDWKDWAISSGKVDASVIAYHIETGGSKLFTFDPKNHETAFATPRSWVFASDMVTASKQSNVSEKMLRILVSGCIGEGIANEFITFRRMEKQIPKTEDILFGKVKDAKDLKDISAKYLVIINLCHYLKNYFGDRNIKSSKDIPENDAKSVVAMCDNFMSFVMEHLDDELTILALQTALFHYRLPFPYQDMTTFDRFCDEYKEFVLD